MSNYLPVYPTGVRVHPGIKEFITNFYGVSDTPGKNQEWADFFEEDATLVMEKKEATGRADILQIREGMWEKVAARKHSVRKVFPASFVGAWEGAREEESREEESRKGGYERLVVELALFGSVEYTLKTGDQDKADWVGHARLVSEDEDAEVWKITYYRVYIQR